VARDIGSNDAKIQRLLTTLQTPLGGPLAFLQAATGISDGLNRRGDLLLAVLPGDAGAELPKFCVWFPVADYERFVASLGSKPASSITAVTVGGVDLLVGKHGDWALVMDPDERERMERMLAAKPTPPRQAAAWKTWIETNDVTCVALSGALHDILTWAATPWVGHGGSAEPAGSVDEDLFGDSIDEIDVAPQNPAGPNRTANDLGTKVLSTVRTVITSSPKMLQWAHAAEATALGVRLDEHGNAVAGVRVVWNTDGNFWPNARPGTGDIGLPARIYKGGEFVVQGTGKVPQPLTAVIAGTYVRLLVDDLKTEMGLALDSNTVTRFQDAVEQAAAEVPAAEVLSVPGEKEDGVYTNHFLVVRVDSAATFVDHTNEVMRLWNQMNRDAENGTRLVFDVEEIAVGGRTATHYTIDIAAADGAPVIPEVRQAMEKLFGPGGKMRLIVAPADDHNVLLAMATPEQAASVLKSLREKQAESKSGDVSDATNKLLPQEGDWKLYVSPHGYNRWLSRQMDAMTGPVFGGPIIKEFPASPPIGIVGGAKDYELWIDAAVPAETIQSAGTYLQNKRPKNPR
jgi:hypothetical protein